MKTQIAALFIFFAFILYSCRSKKENYIDISDVTSIEILKIGQPGDSVIYQSKKLSHLQMESFVNKFDTITNTELRIFLPTYQLNVFFADKSIRTFKTSRRHLKEKTDQCLDFGDKDYFDKLYNNGR